MSFSKLTVFLQCLQFLYLKVVTTSGSTLESTSAATIPYPGDIFAIPSERRSTFSGLNIMISCLAPMVQIIPESPRIDPYYPHGAPKFSRPRKKTSMSTYKRIFQFLSRVFAAPSTQNLLWLATFRMQIILFRTLGASFGAGSNSHE